MFFLPTCIRLRQSCREARRLRWEKLRTRRRGAAADGGAGAPTPEIFCGWKKRTTFVRSMVHPIYVTLQIKFLAQASLELLVLLLYLVLQVVPALKKKFHVSLLYLQKSFQQNQNHQLLRDSPG